MLAQFYLPIVGGEERHVQDLSIELAKRGHDVAVVTLHTPDSAEFDFDQGVRVYHVKSMMQRMHWLYSQTERSFAPPFPDPEVMLALRRIILREKPDIIHAHNWMLYSFLPLKAWSGVPLVLSLHDYSLICVQKRLMHFGTPCSGPDFGKCLHCASSYYGSLKGKVTTLSHRMMYPMERAAVDIFLPVSMATAIGNGLVEQQLPFEVIPNFLSDAADSSPVDVEPYLSQLPEAGYLLFVGDLSLDKGIGVLLRAYAALKDAPPLVLIGRKNHDTPTELPNNVFLLNRWPHAAVMQAWRRSGIALVPSLCAETFGIVAIEAMSMGSPVIASRIGGLTDVLKDGETGFLIPPGDMSSLTQAIQRLLEDKSLRNRMGQNAVYRSQDFRAGQVVPRIEAVYRKLTQMADGVPGISEKHYNVVS
jgi:glycosyltransferase involved in cell wall biosynthesis